MADNGPFSRLIYQAQGMVAVQADCTLDRALVFMQEMAEATDSSLEEIAEDVTSRHVTFRPRP